MSSNTTIARLLEEMAAALTLTGANAFRVRAHERAAQIVEELGQDATSLSLDELMAMDGIGEGTAKKIREFAETGGIAEHAELWSDVPKGLLDVLRVPGLGPKTVKLMWEKAGVTDLASLKARLEDGSVEALPRMGAKTVANIRDALAFMAKAGGRIRIGGAMEVAETIVDHLRSLPGVARVEYAGSLRRGKETIGDVDILASGSEPKAIGDAFVAMDGVEQVLAHGASKCSVRLASGVQADLRLVDQSAFGAALMYFTGSKEHNVRLRERALATGLTLNEYGLFPEDEDEDLPPQQRGIAPVAAETEESIYAALKLSWIPPELREDRGEIDAAERGELPELVELDDIVSELHAHTVASDGALSIAELAEEAIRRGFHTIAVTDHSRSSVQANGLSPERLVEHIEAIRAVQRDFGKRIRLLAGSEVDIHVDGTLDYDDELLEMLDLVVASPHASLRQEPAKATARLLAAVRHPLVHILGHPTGRIINGREGMSPDIAKIAEAARDHGTALEINANPFRLDLRDSHVRLAVEVGCPIAINCDVHGRNNYDLLRYGVLTARRGWLPKDLCVNAWPAKKLWTWIDGKRGR